jgi:hypothetical protein
VSALVSVKNVFQSLFQNLRPRLAPPACAPGLRLIVSYVSLSAYVTRAGPGRLLEFHTCNVG